MNRLLEFFLYWFHIELYTFDSSVPFKALVNWKNLYCSCSCVTNKPRHKNFVHSTLFLQWRVHVLHYKQIRVHIRSRYSNPHSVPIFKTTVTNKTKNDKDPFVTAVLISLKISQDPRCKIIPYQTITNFAISDYAGMEPCKYVHRQYGVLAI